MLSTTIPMSASMTTTMNTSMPARAAASVTAKTATLAAKVCPIAPPGAQAPTDQITGYILWACITAFGLGAILGVLAVVGGRMFGMPHASKAGIVSIAMVFGAVIAYLVLPGMVHSMAGSGCIQ